MKKAIFGPSWSTDLATLLVRVLVAGLFIWHGYSMMINYDEWIKMSHSTLGWGTVFEYRLIQYTELICGVLITIGLLTRLAVLPLMFAMTIAYFVAHRHDAFMMKALPFALMCLTLIVLILGGGRFSADALLSRKNK